MPIDCRAAATLHEVLQDYGPFDEATALFYAANIFLGLEHLHNTCDVAYRNVTPEAIMLGADGYALLMDMRFAREVSDNFCIGCGNANAHSHRAIPASLWSMVRTRFEQVDATKLFDLCGLSPYLAPEQVWAA